MNRLQTEKRSQILNLLVDGNRLRATARIADVSVNTVTKLLVEVGAACDNFHNQTVRNLNSKRIQANEILTFVFAKARNVSVETKGEAGDVWTWTAIDSDSKLIVSWFVGDRNHNSAKEFIKDVAVRVTSRVQISTDGSFAVCGVFGNEVEYEQGKKTYVVQSNSNEKNISTSQVDGENLAMQMRRLTGSTNGFSKKIRNHMCAIAFHFVYYNFVKIHNALTVTPAMEAGLAKKPMTLEEIAELTNVSK